MLVHLRHRHLSKLYLYYIYRHRSAEPVINPKIQYAIDTMYYYMDSQLSNSWIRGKRVFFSLVLFGNFRIFFYFKLLTMIHPAIVQDNSDSQNMCCYSMWSRRKFVGLKNIWNDIRRLDFGLFINLHIDRLTNTTNSLSCKGITASRRNSSVRLTFAAQHTCTHQLIWAQAWYIRNSPNRIEWKDLNKQLIFCIIFTIKKKKVADRRRFKINHHRQQIWPMQNTLDTFSYCVNGCIEWFIMILQLTKFGMHEQPTKLMIEYKFVNWIASRRGWLEFWISCCNYKGLWIHSGWNQDL